jgi:2-dehydropantoate 2-reductase
MKSDRRYISNIQKSPISLLIFGAGAIGSYIGGGLLAANHKIIFLEHPTPAEKLRQQGITWNNGTINHHFPNLNVADNLQDALAQGPFDASIFALKAYDTLSAIEGLRTFKSQLPPMICFQNGVENEDTLRQIYPSQDIIAGVITSAIGRLDIGNIIVERERGVGIADTHPISRKMASAMTEAGFILHLYADERSLKWSKLITNLLANASCAILDLSPNQVLSHAGLYRLEIEQLRETLRVMKALNIKVENLPATPVRALVAAVQHLHPSLSQPLLSRIAGSGRGGKMPSFHIDLFSKKGKSEVDYLNGAVVRFGKQVSIPTPVNTLLNNTLLGITNGEIDPNQFIHNPEALLNLWRSS